MTPLTTKDREVLGLYAARMSTASISAIAGGTEASIYNRLTRLEVNSVAQALAMLQADDDARKAPKPPPAPKPVRAKPSPPPVKVSWITGVEKNPVDASEPRRVRPVYPEPVFVKPEVTDEDLAAAAPFLASLSGSPIVAAAPPLAPVTSPAAVSSPASSMGRLRLKPVSDRIERWAGHFLRARWPLQEVADLFDVAEDDLAQACGVPA